MHCCRYPVRRLSASTASFCRRNVAQHKRRRNPRAVVLPSSHQLQEELANRVESRERTARLIEETGIDQLQSGTPSDGGYLSVAALNYASATADDFGEDDEQLLQFVMHPELLAERRTEVFREFNKKHGDDLPYLDPPEIPVEQADIMQVELDPEAVEQQRRKANLRPERLMVDRGFHVSSNKFADDYTEGSAMDLPDLNVYSINPDVNLAIEMGKDITGGQVNRKQLARSDGVGSEALVRAGGSTEPVEDIEFRLPHQRAPKKEISQMFALQTEDSMNDWAIRYGVADETVPISSHTCVGCGAALHCQRPAVVGFLPRDLFLDRQKENFRDTLCRRCYLMKHHNFMLNVTVSNINYNALLNRLKGTDDTLIVLVVDLLDMPGSLYRHLPQAIGERKPMIVVGNKVDLISPDADGYLKRFKETLVNYCRALNLHHHFNILTTLLISAKIGYGVEHLVTAIQSRWGRRDDIYLIGCTNTGKSTLFNALLQSDLCKIQAVDLVERATTSVWPGTTLNLLKFPVMKLTAQRLVEREHRLELERAVWRQERRHRMMILKDTGDSRYAMLQGYVGRTGNDLEQASPAIKADTTSIGFCQELPVKDSKKKLRKEFSELNDWSEHWLFSSGNWCFDTPGTVSQDQIINELTMEELVKMVPRSIVLPRTFSLMRGQSLLFGGIGRVEYTDGPHKYIYATCFTSKHLPIHVLWSREVDAFLNKYSGTSILGVPLGSKERVDKLSKLRGREMTTESFGYIESFVDVQLSSIGWVSFTGARLSRYTVSGFTPGGRGLFFRQPCLLPYAVTRRGNRIPGSQAYKCKSVEDILYEDIAF